MEQGSFLHTTCNFLYTLVFMDGIQTTLKGMDFPQMVLALIFVASYALAVGGMLGPIGSARAGGTAIASAGAFAAFSADWIPGVLLAVFTVGGVGLFVAAAWLLIAIGRRIVGIRADELDEISAESSEPLPSTFPSSSFPNDLPPSDYGAPSSLQALRQQVITATSTLVSDQSGHTG